MVGGVGQLVVLLIGGNMVLDGTLSIGGLTAFVLYLTAFFAPIQQLVQLYSTYQSGQAAVDKLRDLLATDPPWRRRRRHAAAPHGRPHRARRVGFAYEPGQPVLDDVDLEIAAGETIALVGPTGREVHAGQARRALLRPGRRAGPASTATTSATSPSRRSASNWASCRRSRSCSSGRCARTSPSPGPTPPTTRSPRACRAVGLDDLLDRLPDGLDTFVHERGTIAVVGRAPAPGAGPRLPGPAARARARRGHLVARPEERVEVEHALDVVLDGRTAIVIAHRLATAKRADRIAVVDRAHRGARHPRRAGRLAAAPRRCTPALCTRCLRVVAVARCASAGPYSLTLDGLGAECAMGADSSLADACNVRGFAPEDCPGTPPAAPP